MVFRLLPPEALFVAGGPRRVGDLTQLLGVAVVALTLAHCGAGSFDDASQLRGHGPLSSLSVADAAAELDVLEGPACRDAGAAPVTELAPADVARATDEEADEEFCTSVWTWRDPHVAPTRPEVRYGPLSGAAADEGDGEVHILPVPYPVLPPPGDGAGVDEERLEADAATWASGAAIVRLTPAQRAAFAGPASAWYVSAPGLRRTQAQKLAPPAAAATSLRCLSCDVPRRNTVAPPRAYAQCLAESLALVDLLPQLQAHDAAAAPALLRAARNVVLRSAPDANLVANEAALFAPRAGEDCWQGMAEDPGSAVRRDLDACWQAALALQAEATAATAAGSASPAVHPSRLAKLRPQCLAVGRRHLTPQSFLVLDDAFAQGTELPQRP